MKLRVLACILGVSLAAAGCNRTADDNVAENATPMNETTAPAGTSGTTTTDDQSAFNTADTRQDDTFGTAGLNDTELPDTASPLGLAGLVGLLALAGAAGVRRLRRR